MYRALLRGATLSSACCRYIPPLLWGRNGHLQTVIHSTLSRHKTPREKGDSRHKVLLSDGSTVTFDVFEPFETTEQHTISSTDSPRGKTVIRHILGLLLLPSNR